MRVTDLVLLAVLAVAVWTDLRTGQVKNWLTAPVVVIGPLMHLAVSGRSGAIESLMGVALMFPVGLLLWSLRFVRGGDAKLLIAVGALAGRPLVLNVLLYSALAGGVMALVVLLRRLGVAELFRRAGFAVKLGVGHGISPKGTIDQNETKMPYTLAITAGTLLAILARP